MKKLLNNYVQIEPVEHKSFISSSNQTYEEIGVVIASDAKDIPVGCKVYFDSYMAKKYPIEGEVNKFHWFVHHDEVVAYDK